MDVAAAVAGLVAVAPLMLIVAAAVRISLGRPVLFRQLRPGLDGRPFLMYKFRTMIEPAGGVSTHLDRSHSDGERLTRLGKFLRATSLDELPELWNVLRGEMSLVGPRPLLLDYLDRYTPEQARRHEVKPGLTGWAQVNGRNAISWEERFALDVWYVDNYDLRLDIRILLLTAWKVLRRDAISAPFHATMPGFTGLTRASNNHNP